MSSENKDWSLGEEEIQKFKDQGFLGPFDLYSRREANDIWKSVRRSLADRSSSIYAGGKAVSELANIANYDRHFDIPELGKHICRPEIVHRVRSLLGSNLLAWRSEFFLKAQGDEGTDWHQVADFSHASGKPQLIWPEGQDHLGGTVTVWTALTDSNKRNGCLQLMPGTHKKLNYDESKGLEYNSDNINKKVKNSVKRGFFGYDFRDLQIDEGWSPDESQAYPVEMRAGQFLIFWSTLMHASYPHRSSATDTRVGYACRYVPTEVQVYPDTKELNEYGGTVSLDRYGTILVSGEDTYGHNKLVTTDVHGQTFDKQG